MTTFKEISKGKYERIVFIGGILDEKYKEEIEKKLTNFLPHSADIFQKNMINGLLENGIRDITILNSQYIGTYPRYYSEKKVFGKETYYATEKDIKFIDTTFINLPFINKKSRYLALIQELNKNFNVNEKILFIVYSLLPHNADVINYIKKRYLFSKVTLVITDFPEYMTLQEDRGFTLGKIYHLLDNKLNEKKILKCFLNVDYYILLSKYMKELIPNIKEENVCIMEGILDTTSFDIAKVQQKYNKRKIIVYTGALEENLGITDLIKSFKKLDLKDYRLVIAGDGTCRELIKTSAKEDNYIYYLGSLTKEDTIKLQLSADILVCPTHTGMGCSKYAFPCKLLEYLYTGNKVIATKLECIPEEYETQIIFSENGVNGLSEAIKEAIKMNKDIDIQQINWIKKNKSTIGQMKRIIEFVSK